MPKIPPQVDPSEFVTWLNGPVGPHSPYQFFMGRDQDRCLYIGITDSGSGSLHRLSTTDLDILSVVAKEQVAHAQRVLEETRKRESPEPSACVPIF